MDFQLNDEQLLIRNTVREFVEQHVKALAAEIDKKHRFPAESVPMMAELGLLGFNLPEEYGGMGDTVSYLLATEEMAKVSAAHAMIMGSQCSLTAPILLKHSSKEICARIIPDMIAGKKLACFCLTEAEAGCDAGAQKTTAVRKGDSYVLNGAKLWITNAPVCDVFIVFAMTDAAKGLKGISCFLVEKGVAGLSTGQPEDKMGMGGSLTTEVVLQDVVIPASNLLGQEGMGFKIAMETLDAARISCAGLSLGIAQGALDSTIAYTKQRIQFGRPIAANQGVQWMIADMATRLDAARLLAYRAASFKDARLPYSKEAAMAKVYAAEAAMWITTKAVQLHGGIGYTSAFPVERLMREAKITEIFEGTSEVQRIVIAKHVLD